jgi:hypothetical protein
MKFTYDKVKNDIWEVIKNRTEFVYEPSSECDVCTDHSDWEYDPEGYGDEPPTCDAHYDGDACRYFYADNRGFSQYDAPACVVGNWFTHEGFIPQDLNVSNWDELEGQGVRTLLEKANFDIDDDALTFLSNMQTFQDTGISWGNSFERAVANAEGTENE